MNKVTRFGKLSMLTLLVSLTGLTSLKAQDPTPIWSVEAPTSNWFLNDNNTRGLGFNPSTGHLIVASRSGGLKAVLVDAATGDSVGVLSTTGITGGTFPYHHIRATSDGQIFASNLVTANTSNFKVYRWADEASEPTVIFDGATTVSARIGDSFQVVGSGNAVTILASGSGTIVAKVMWDGATGSLTEITVPAGKARGGFSSAVNDSTVWVTGTGTPPAPFDFKNGTLGADLISADLVALPQATLNSVMTNDAFWMFGKSYLMAGPAFTGGKFWILNAQTGAVVKSVGPIGGNTNTNNTGGVIVDKTKGRVYIMDSNNSIKAFNLSDLVNTTVFSESFDYEDGSLLTANGWVSHSGTTDFIPVDPTSLTYAGYAGSGGKSARLVKSGEDVNRKFSLNTESGSVFASFMMNVTSASVNGEYFFHYVNSQGTGAEFRGRVSVKADANGKLAFGISKAAGASSSTYTDFNYDANKTYLLVVEYVRVEGAANDEVNLYVNPIGSTLPETATVSAADTDGTDIIELTNIAIRQGSASPAGLIGGIRVGYTYDVVVGNPEAPKMDYMVTFKADMNAAIDSANFVPGTHNVWVRGGFNGWGDNGNTDTLKDDNADGIYEITKMITEGTYDYKFYVTSRQYGGGQYENDPSNNVVVDGDKMLEPKKPNITFDNYSNTNFANVAINFEVNMEVQILKGAFNKATDVLEARGSFNGWSAGTVLTEGLRPNIFETVQVMKDFALGSEIAYKFTTTVAGNTNWESPISTDGGDRKYTIEDREYTTEEQDEAGNVVIFVNDEDKIPFFNDITADDIFTTPGTATFVVDLRPAFYYLADSSKLPADVQTTDTTTAIRGLYVNGPLLATNGGWEDWGEAKLGAKQELRLYDDGTNGDLVANDTLYSRLFNFAPGKDKVGVYKYGINGLDNEAFASENHSVRFEDGGVITNIYGAIKLSNGTIYKALYSPYIGVDGENIYVRRRANGDAIPNAVENDNAIPGRFALNQNYPNPFNPSTTINIELSKATNVTLSVYNVLGQKVQTLVNGQAMNAGTYNFNFDASKLASGMYIYRLQAGTFTATKTMTLIK